MSDKDHDSRYEFDINQYELGSVIGSGAYGTVYKAKEITTGKIYAAKILNNEIDYKTSRDNLRNLIREVVNMSKLNHPSVVKFIGFSPINYDNKLCPVIITEYLPKSLKTLFEKEEGGLSELDSTDKLKILYGIASAMKYLHENDIIHRDLKLDNILLDDEKNPKVVDFGFSKCLNKTKIDVSDSTDAYKGTPLFSAPEILFDHNYQKPGDVYAFGMIAYIIISNEIPFKGISFDQLLIQIANGVRPDLEFITNDAYKSLIERCLDQDFMKRPTFEEIVDELENNRDFITDDIDEGEFLSYVDFIKESPSSFDEGKPIISFDDYNNLILEKKKERARECFILAKNLFFGNDMPVNKRKAAYNCKIAADLGDTEAAFNYALILYKGDGIAKNMRKAEDYLKNVYHENKDFSFGTFYGNDSELNKWLNEFKLKKYIDEKKEYYDQILRFIDDENDYDTLTNFLEKIDFTVSKYEFKLFFDLIISIANNHKRHPNFFNNISKIILYFKEHIKRTFTNFEVFDIFKSNKLILLFLFDNEIISVDKRIYIELIRIKESNGIGYCDFFFPEIKKYLEEDNNNFIDINELENKISNIINFEEKRRAGENDSYLCFLIRKDFVDQFELYTIHENISLSSHIRPSIFETNSFLNENSPTLLEYAAFFGSNKIIQYLLEKEIELTPSFWLYSIHNEHFESKSNLNYGELLAESIKCHNNGVANLIERKLAELDIEKQEIEEIKFLNILQFNNYSYFTFGVTKDCDLFNLFQYGYYQIVNFLFKIKDGEIKEYMVDQISNNLF